MTYNSKMEAVARALRISGTVGFIVMLVNANQFNAKTLAEAIGATPVPVLISESISFTIAIGAQIWLRFLLKAKRAETKL